MKFSLRWEWAGRSVLTNGKRPKIRYGEMLLRRHEDKIAFRWRHRPSCSTAFPLAVALFSGTAKCLDHRTRHYVSINWHFDDTTISETISKNQDSHIQAAVDTLASRATVDKFQLNETKCKELLINFNTNNSTSFHPVVVNGMPIDLVTSAQILGLNISNDLKWNCHIDSIIKKAKKRCIAYLSLNALVLVPVS